MLWLALPGLTPLAATAATDEDPLLRWGIGGLLCIVLAACGAAAKKLLEAHLANAAKVAEANDRTSRAVLMLAREFRFRPCTKESPSIRELDDAAGTEGGKP
jgi:cell division septum initiation protein DivIVA